MRQNYWYLKNCDLLTGIDEDQLTKLDRRSQLRTYPAGSPIYLPAQSASDVLLVVLGVVKVCHLTRRGKLTTLAFIRPGEIFGELALFDAARREEYVEANSDTTLVKLPKDAVLEVMSSDSTVVLRLSKLMGMRRQKTERRLRNLLFTSNEHRLIHLLLELTEDLGLDEPPGIRLNLKLSHQELANLIGTTRETVSILMGRLKSDGILAGHRQTVVINDLAKLRRRIADTP